MINKYLLFNICFWLILPMIKHYNKNLILLFHHPTLSKSLASFSVFGSSSGGDNEEILQELKEMKLKQEEAKSKAAKIKSAYKLSTNNKESGSIFELAQNHRETESEDNTNKSPSGSPSVELLNKLRESGRNIDNSNIYDRFAAAMKYREKKKNVNKK